MKPIKIGHDAFTLSSSELCSGFLSKAIQVRALVGTPGSTPLPAADEAFMGIGADTVGLIVAAESMAVISRSGELDEAAVVSSNQRWWAYWKEYWKRKQSKNPLPRDYACEVTIPVGDL